MIAHDDDNSTDGRTASPESEARETDQPDAFRDIPRYLGELKEYAWHYAAAKFDLFKLSARNVFFVAFLWLLGGLTTVAVMMTSVVLLLVGIAHALGMLLGGREWLGELIVGLVVMGGFGAFALYVLAQVNRAVLLKTERKYEAAREYQRKHFGHDVAERAAGAGEGTN